MASKTLIDVCIFESKKFVQAHELNHSEPHGGISFIW